MVEQAALETRPTTMAQMVDSAVEEAHRGVLEAVVDIQAAVQISLTAQQIVAKVVVVADHSLVEATKFSPRPKVQLMALFRFKY